MTVVPAARRPRSTRAVLVAGWALGGLSLTFLQAITRLGARGVHTIANGLTAFEWAVLVLLTLVFVYGEGFRGIQQHFAPRVVQRLHELFARRARWQLLGPLYLLSLVGAAPRTMLRAWIGVAAIVVAVLIIRALPEPWRGIIDFAVVAALTWGLIAILAAAGRSLQRGRLDSQAT
jgi:hypothetical protein